MAPRRALVVEDDPGIAEVIRLLLADQAVVVEDTRSGLEGVVRAARAPALDLAIVDIDVLELSGMGVTRAVRDFSCVPLIVMSGREGPWRSDALRTGATACLAKPFDPRTLEAVVTATLLAADGSARPWRGDVRALAPDDLARIARLAPEEVDALPFGAIRVGAAGQVVTFNAYEQRLAGLDPTAVIGRRFSDVAPCTQVREFLKPIEEGRARGALDQVLRFVFPRRGALCVVSVRVFLDSSSGELWLFISQRPREDARPRPSGPA